MVLAFVRDRLGKEWHVIHSVGWVVRGCRHVALMGEIQFRFTQQPGWSRLGQRPVDSPLLRMENKSHEHTVP